MHARYRNNNQMSRSLSAVSPSRSYPSARTLHCACLTYSRSHVISYAQANIYSTAAGYKQPHPPPHTHHDRRRPSVPDKRYSIYIKNGDLRMICITPLSASPTRRRSSTMMISTTQRRSDCASQAAKLGQLQPYDILAFCELGSPVALHMPPLL
jgi:hypothetical protein